MTILLAPVARRDAAALIEANRDSIALHRPWVRPFTDEAGFDAWFQRLLGGPMAAWVAREKATAQITGVVTLSEIVGGGFQNAYLGYYGSRATAGRGWMTEAVRQACRLAFDELGLHRLEANIQPENAASIALVRRIGFRLEGFSPRYLFLDGAWRDHQRWALLADELPRPPQRYDSGVENHP